MIRRQSGVYPNWTLDYGVYDGLSGKFGSGVPHVHRSRTSLEALLEVVLPQFVYEEGWGANVRQHNHQRAYGLEDVTSPDAYRSTHKLARTLRL